MMGELPTVRLAHMPHTQGDNVLLPAHLRSKRYASHEESKVLPVGNRPGLLMSYYYLPRFERHLEHWAMRDWVLDSGAFSAMNSGKAIALEQYIEDCHRLLRGPRPPSEIFALDVIGDHRASRRNTERMWEAGIEAIPTYHHGSPPDELECIARDYPKIALGGVARKSPRGSFKLDFARACFSRIWPARIHGFGYGLEEHILALPWHSVDATSWLVGVCQFGKWRSFGKSQLGLRGSKVNIRAEVEYYLGLEKRARGRWARTWAKVQERLK
jgi:hypothetical protein